MTSNSKQASYIECPFCQGLLEPKTGKQKCSECHVKLEINDRLESIFVDTHNLRLPINGTVCNECGLVQGGQIRNCGYCGGKCKLQWIKIFL